MTERTANDGTASLAEVHDELMLFVTSHRAVEPGMEQLVKRVTRAVAGLLLRLPPGDVPHVLEAPRDIFVLLLLMERDPRKVMPLDPSEPTFRERLESVQIEQALVEAAGGALSISQTAALLGVQDEDVRQQIQRGMLLGIKLWGTDHILPACQFEGGQALPRLEDVLQALVVQDGWTQLGDLLAPLYALGGTRTLLDLLREGDSEYAMELASRMHDTGAV